MRPVYQLPRYAVDGHRIKTRAHGATASLSLQTLRSPDSTVSAATLYRLLREARVGIDRRAVAAPGRLAGAGAMQGLRLPRCTRLDDECQFLISPEVPVK